jgi:virulence protein VirJ
MSPHRLMRGVVVCAAIACSSCAIATTAHSDRSDLTITLHELVAATVLHGKHLDLHIATPAALMHPDVLVVYGSGDGGWFGAAVDQWRTIARSGYATVGFSSRAFLRIERPPGAALNTARLANEYELIVQDARRALGWQHTAKVILAGWSRGAAFAVLAGSEPVFRSSLVGVMAIGLAEGENLTVDDSDTDEGRAGESSRHWLFDIYARLPQLPAPYAVIQATGDNYFPAARARQRFGPDTATRRFYQIEAKNHRFSGGSTAFEAALMDVLTWLSSGAGSHHS